MCKFFLDRNMYLTKSLLSICTHITQTRLNILFVQYSKLLNLQTYVTHYAISEMSLFTLLFFLIFLLETYTVLLLKSIILVATNVDSVKFQKMHSHLCWLLWMIPFKLGNSSQPLKRYYKIVIAILYYENLKTYRLISHKFTFIRT